MNIKKIKILIIITILVFGIIGGYNKTFASEIDDYIRQGDDFIAARREESVINEEALADTSSTIYNILFSIALVLAFAVGMIIGIQFIVASVDEKAKIKETLVPYVIGVFVIFSAFTIWKITIKIGNDVVPTPEAKGTLQEYEGMQQKSEDRHISSEGGHHSGGVM